MGNDGDTSIKISKAARARLGTLAGERGTSVRALVEELAQAQPTQKELQARGDIARSYMRDQMGVDVTPEDETAGDRLLQAIAARTEGPRSSAE